MDRLYEVKVDEKRWKAVKLDNTNYHSYKIIDKKKQEIYFLKDFIGLEQVTDDEFLVFRRLSWDYFEIDRCRLQESKIVKLFAVKFNDFHFISDDRILFTYYDNNGSYRCKEIYSIKDNKMLEEAKWLGRVDIDVIEDKDNPNKITLYAKKTLYSSILNDPKLLFAVDPETLQPKSDCYSQLRNKYIKVSSKEDIEKIESEDERYIKIMESQISEQECKELQEAKEVVLGRKKVSK